MICLTADSTIDRADELISTDATKGQDIIDSLTTLRLISPFLHTDLYPKILSLFPHIICALQSTFSVMRNTAAKCLAALCDVMCDEGMGSIVDVVVPLVGDAKRVASRQGAVEAVHRESACVQSVNESPSDTPFRHHQSAGDQGFALCAVLDRSHSRTNERSRRVYSATLHVDVRFSRQDGSPRG